MLLGYEPSATTDDGGPGTFVDDGIAEISIMPIADSVFESVRDRMLRRHDSVFSVDSNYKDPSDNDLSVWQGAALLTADCLGVGLLALPEDIRVLGRWIGIGFLLLNLPVNLYAGIILSDSAEHVERIQAEENEIYLQRQLEVMQQGEVEELSASSKDGLMIESPKKNRGNRGKDYATLEQTDQDENNITEEPPATTEGGVDKSISEEAVVDRTPKLASDKTANHQAVHHDTATFDFVGMTQALFSSRKSTRIVMAVFYTNIFLVLGDYILVMSHAVSALVGEEKLCIPQAGILASVLMYALAQIRTMANLGRAATVISLSSLFVVVIQCLWAVHINKTETYVEASPEDFDQDTGLLRKFSALGSIGFAVSSQKLFLNIRHELAERSKASKTLAISISSFGIVYVSIIMLAGSNPPGFLFDAIPPGWNRRLAGFLLWVHVAVSYAINSQAICASMDRLFFSSIEVWELNTRPKLRWLFLTAILSVTAFVVANAVPFFKDLVALIGALTSVPLSLHLPAVFFRRYLQVPIWLPTRQTLSSYALLVFASVFMGTALAGALSSIELDWSSHGGSFACH